MKKGILYIALIIAILALWQYFGSTNNTVRLLVSSPSLVYHYFVENSSDLLEATKITSLEAILGLLLATIFSFGMMILCFYFPKLMDFVLPIMITSQVIPLIALAPFLIMILGNGLVSKIVMSLLMCFFPIFVNFAQGYKSINLNIHELMYTYNAPSSFKIWNVYFPLSMPSIIAGLKVSATLSVIGAIVAEFNGSDIGLGKNLFLAAKRLEPEMMLSSLFASALIGFAMFFAIIIIDKFVLKWK